MSTIRKLRKRQLRAEKRLLLLQQELRHHLLLSKELEENLSQYNHRLLELNPLPLLPPQQSLQWLTPEDSTTPS